MKVDMGYIEPHYETIFSAHDATDNNALAEALAVIEADPMRTIFGKTNHRARLNPSP